MTLERYLIVNADDFGQSYGVNQGIIEAHERGIVTSASLMVRWPAAVDAGDYARTHPRLSIGLHFDLGEWVYREDVWTPLYEVASPDDLMAVRDELSRQLTTFRDLVDVDPTHIDSHQHVHRSEPVRALLMEAAGNLGVPLRDCNSIVRYSGRFYGQSGKGDPVPDAISVEALLRILEELPFGITELGCHPGLGYDLDSPYRLERPQEVMTLCDPRIRDKIVAGAIQLCSFREVGSYGG
jgi:predicted glycoside hydrolase/deacetylase ChbG (UPF0249 family)